MKFNFFDYPTPDKIKHGLKKHDHFEYIKSEYKNIEKYKFGNEVFFLTSKFKDIEIVNERISELLNSLSSESIKYLYKWKDQLVKNEVFHSLDIEGIRTTKGFINSTILNSLSKKSTKIEEKEAIAAVAAMGKANYFAEAHYPINEEAIGEIYKLLTSNLELLDLKKEDKIDEINYFRKQPIFITNKVAFSELDLKKWEKGIDYENIEKFLNDLFEFANNNDDAIDIFDQMAIIHLIFGRIHPYLDGNGRMIRLISYWFLTINWQRIVKQYKIKNPIINLWQYFGYYSEVIKANKKNYYLAFEYSIKSNDLSYFVYYNKFVIKEMLEMLNWIIEDTKTYKENSGKELTDTMFDVLRTLYLNDYGQGLTMKDLLSFNGNDEVSRQAINTNLQLLVKNKIIDEITSGKGGMKRYFLREEILQKKNIIY